MKSGNTGRRAVLVGLILENVRGKSGTYNFGKLTKLLGKNEVGKSGIKEAICYAFAGTDSAGLRSPTHLITNGAEGCKIIVQTEKVEIHRTLTRKGSQSLSLMKDGVRVPLTQAQLSERLGATPDLFLSVFLPGYFMSLTEERRRAVLAEVLPPIDRRALLDEIAGTFVLDEELAGVDLSRRPDSAAAVVATTRRAVKQQLAQVEGQRESYLAIARANAAAPVAPPPGIEDRLSFLSHLVAAWADYAKRRAVYDNAKQQADLATQRNAGLEKERTALLAERDAIKDVTVWPVEVSSAAKIEELRQTLKTPPERPSSFNLPSSDRCPSCGQAVGSKHRDKVKSDNEKAAEEYNAVLVEISKHNEAVNAEIARLGAELKGKLDEQRVAKEANAQRANRRFQLEAKAAALSPMPVPQIPPEPTEPSEKYDGEEHRKLEAAHRSYLVERGRYEQQAQQRDEADQRLAQISLTLSKLQLDVQRFELIESAILRIPAAELAKQAELLAIDGYTFSLEGTSVARADGMPYAMLSTGAGMRADTMLSVKLNSLMKRPVGVLFLDNADLIDSLPPAASSVQLFLALVRPEVSTLTVEAS